jgi:class 3 adenylate cyclase
MLVLNRLSIQSKMILLLLTVSLLSVAIMAVIGYTSAKAALTRSIEDHLKGVRVAKTTTLKAMLDSLRDQVISMSDSRAAIEGMRAFGEAIRDLSSSKLSAPEEEKLENFYREEFLPRLAKHLDGEPVLENFLPKSSTARYLQYHYIAANPLEYFKKQDLETSATDGSLYGQTHARLHKFFSRAVKIFGFEDLMLVDADSLQIVYSYQKTTEFGTSLESGPYAHTNLGDRARILRSSRDRDDFKIADFEPYRPSLGSPMGFAMSPIFDGAQMIGILVLQFPIENFNKVLSGNYNWQQEGMGTTGESYVVGPDKTMRSRSRFMFENPQAFIETLRESGTSTKILDRIERQGTVMNTLMVNTASVEEALRGREGITTVIDYRGKPVLSAYGPIELDSLRWAVIAEMDETEANAPIREFGRKVLIASSAITLVVSLLALLSSHFLTLPLRALADGARRLGAGETDVKVAVSSRDEFGDLAQVFNSMCADIKSQTEELEARSRENQELLLNILPASAIAQRQEGDERASRQFADVTVLFSEIIGMEEVGARLGEEKALGLLADLIAAFDEAADKSGIEKVRTIGGSYLAVCGLSVTRPDHARRTILFAEEMARIVQIFNSEHHMELGIAIGINSGPVVGGVVGRRKFLYDLWGDTVTIAKKLTSGKGGIIRVTGNVRERMGEQFSFSGPLQIDLDGRPSLEVWQIAV